MAEFNPYKLEEEKWTPKNVYEILPPNSVSWSDYDFGQGTDNVDGEAAKKSFIDGFVDFFAELLGTAGQILGGALELGGKILGGFVDGVVSLIGGIANAIGSIFGGGSGESPDLPLFNPIKTNLEAAIKPHRDKINESWQKTEEILAQQEILVGQMEVSLEDMREASRKSKEASDRAGEAIGRAEAASAAAREARETLEEYNEALTKQIREEFNAAVGRAETAIEKAEAANAELVTMNTKLGEITQQASDINDRLGEYNQKFADGLDTANLAIEEAVSVTAAVRALAEENEAKVASAISEAEKANDELALLSPKVADAVDKSAEATDKVATLTPQVSEAVTQAGAAVDKANQTLSEYTAWSKAQKTRIDSAISKAEKATSDLAALSPQVADAVAQSAAATDKVSTLTPQVSEAVDKAGEAVDKADAVTSAYSKFRTEQQARIDTAVSKAEKAAADLATLSPKITDAVDKATKASSEVSAMTSQVSEAKAKAEEAYTEVGKFTSKIEEAQTKGESALTVADQAIDWLKNPVEIGSSLIALDVETKEPHYLQWAGSPATPSTAGLPFTKAVRVNSSEQVRHDAPADMRVPVKVSPDLTYKWSVWVYSNKIGTEIGFLTTSDSIGLCVEETTYKSDERTSTSSWGIFVKDIPLGWSKQEGTIKFQQATDNVRLYAVEWNKTEVASASQWFAALDIVPDVPTQASVDKAQNDAIRANQDILRQQDEINEAQRVANLAQDNFNDNQKKWNQAVDRSLATQKTVNDNFNEWTAGAATAIEANTTAVKALSKIDTGESLIAYLTPSDAEVKAGTAKYDVPVWTTATQKKLASNHSVVTSLPSPRKDVYGVEKGYGTHRANTVKVKVRPNTKYLWSFWSWGSGDLVIYMYGDGGYPVKATRQIKVDQAAQEEARTEDGRRVYDSARNGNRTTSNGTQWLLSGFDFGEHDSKWIYNMYEVEFTSTTTEVWFDSFYWNWNTPSTGGQYLADMQFVPDVPTQASVDAAQNKAIEAFDLFMDNQKKWNDGTQAALDTQKTVNDNFNKWTDGATEAIEANKNAIKALTKPEIGSSLIALDADTREPHYMQWAGDRASPSSDVPFSHAVRNNSSTETRFDAPAGQRVPVKLNPDLTYKWSVWIYSNKSNARIAFLTTSDSIGLCVEKTTYKHTKKTNTSKWGIFVDDISTGWSKYEGTIKFLPGADNVHLYSVEWNKSNIANVSLWFSSLDIVPDVPTQAQVDDAQNTALEAHDLLFKKQDEWNKGTKAALDAQDKVDKNLQKWTEGAEKAIEANTRALAIINAPKQGNNIVPVNPDSGRPWFAEPLKESTDHPPLTSGPTYYSPASQTSVTTYGPYVEVDPKIRYTLSFWAKASKAGSVFYGQFRSQEGRTVTPTGESLTKGAVTVANPPQPSNKDSNGKYVHAAQSNSYFVANLKLNTKWTYYETEIQFNEGVTAVSIMRMYWSHTNGIKANQYISGLSIRPQIPTQASVDKAQNDAIKANKDLLVEQERINVEQRKINTLRTDFEVEQKKINNKQTGINALNTKADDSLLQGLKALGKKALGASLVPYKTPSDQEVKDYSAGKLNYDPWADPEYFDAGHSVVANTTYGRYARANSSQGTNSIQGTLVSVDSSIEYRIKFDAYAQDAGSILVVYMEDQNGNAAVQSTSVRDSGNMSGSSYLIDYLTLKKGWNSYSGRIKFRPTTTETRFTTFYWNHPNGVSTLQGLTNLEIVPDIPDANVVNLLQEEAILENTRIGKENNTAIKALESGLDAAIELGDANIQIEALEIELSKEAEKREALQRKVDDLQNEMIPRTIVSDDRVLYDDYVTLSGTKVTAKTGWSGQMAVTYIERTGHGSSSTPYVYKTRVTRKSVPDGTTREWSFPSGIERVDYWVYQGRPRTILLANAGPYITGKSFSSGTWGVLATHKVGKTYGTGKIEWRANLQYADRGVTYRFKIEVNGTEIKNYKWTGVGPLTGLGSGKKTLRFEHEFSLPDDATVRVLGYAYNSNSQQARVSLLQGTLHYTQDTAREG